MCGRFTLTRSAAEVAEHFGLVAAPAFPPHWNAAPTQELPVVRVRSSGERALELRHWGLVPSWAKDVATGARRINARVESVLREKKKADYVIDNTGPTSRTEEQTRKICDELRRRP
jgi:putative SOS response-associated peptidase YedK